MPNSSLYDVILPILGIVVFVIAFVRTDFAMIILVFSMLLSPEFSVGKISSRAVTIRIEDVLLIVVCLAWVARAALSRGTKSLRPTPLLVPIIVYIFIELFSTFFGVIEGHIELKKGFFYFLKYVEYYLLYFMVTNNLLSRKQARVLVYSLLFVAIVTSLYGWGQRAMGIERIAAPFDSGKNEPGEANTLGGYLVIMMMVTIGIFLNYPATQKVKFFLIALMVFAGIAVLFTLSRGSWIAFIGGYIVLMMFTRKGRPLLFIILLFFVFSGKQYFPKDVQQRVKMTFESKRNFAVGGKHIHLEESAAARVDAWSTAFRYLALSPVFGYGVGSTGVVIDNQYARVILEGGILGSLAFAWLLAEIFRNFLFNLKLIKEDRFFYGMGVGLVAAYVAILLHSFSADTFVLIRMMEPFWFMAAILSVLPELPEEEGFAVEQVPEEFAT